LGYPPFYGDDPVATCRKILHWRTTLKFPSERVRHLSPECLDFVKRLLTDVDTRLGRHGADEVMQHPWFAGVAWDGLHAQEAPYNTPALRAVAQALATLRRLPAGHADEAATLKTLASNFDVRVAGTLPPLASRGARGAATACTSYAACAFPGRATLRTAHSCSHLVTPPPLPPNSCPAQNFDELAADDPRRAPPGGGAGDGGASASLGGLATHGSRKVGGRAGASRASVRPRRAQSRL
jgi:hypothetical protein